LDGDIPEEKKLIGRISNRKFLRDKKKEPILQAKNTINLKINRTQMRFYERD